jgi:hypothetical protein
MSLNGEPAHEEVEKELLHSAAALRSLPDGVVICGRLGNINCSVQSKELYFSSRS